MLDEFGKLSERQVASYSVKVLEGLDYLHHNNIVHGNLKAANILMTKNRCIKLADFGLSLHLHEIKHGGTTCTPNWTAPEVIALWYTSTRSDIWSFGCTVIELLTGQPPYSDIGHTTSSTYSLPPPNKPGLLSGKN
jgi:serine/threonine protein kinase